MFTQIIRMTDKVIMHLVEIFSTRCSKHHYILNLHSTYKSTLSVFEPLPGFTTSLTAEAIFLQPSCVHTCSDCLISQLHARRIIDVLMILIGEALGRGPVVIYYPAGKRATDSELKQFTN